MDIIQLLGSLAGNQQKQGPPPINPSVSPSEGLDDHATDPSDGLDEETLSALLPLLLHLAKQRTGQAPNLQQREATDATASRLFTNPSGPTSGGPINAS